LPIFGDFLPIFGDFCQFLAIFANFWRFLPIFGDFYQFSANWQFPQKNMICKTLSNVKYICNKVIKVCWKLAQTSNCAPMRRHLRYSLHRSNCVHYYVHT
jgi:hypothetical protein